MQIGHWEHSVWNQAESIQNLVLSIKHPAFGLIKCKGVIIKN